MKATPPFQALSAIRHIYDMYRKISLTLYRQKFDKSSNFLYFKGFLNLENFSTEIFSKSLFYTIQDIVIGKIIFPQDLVYKHLWIFESTDPQIYITLSTKCGKLVENFGDERVRKLRCVLSSKKYPESLDVEGFIDYN